MNPYVKAVRPSVLRAPEYRAALQLGPGYIKLNSNENPYPLPEPIVSKVLEAVRTGHNLYPEETADTLRGVVADVYGLRPGNILVGNGTSELLSVLYRSMLDPGERVAMPSPGFTLNRKLAGLQGGRLLEVPWAHDYGLPVEQLLDSGAKFIVLATPNNPTGTAVSMEAVRYLLERFDGPVVVDEAYSAFCEETALPMLEEFPNLIVLRTCSKSYSAAGIRVGFAFACDELIAQFSKVQPLYVVDSIAQRIATEVFKNLNLFQPSIERIKAQRDRTERDFARRGFAVVPSQANFVLAYTPGAAGGVLWQEELKKRRILVRRFDESGLTDAIRVGIGTEEQMALVMNAVDEILAGTS